MRDQPQNSKPDTLEVDASPEAFDQALDRLEAGDEPIYLTENGEAKAVLVNARHYQRIHQQIAALNAQLTKGRPQ